MSANMVTRSPTYGWRISIIDLLHQIREKMPKIGTEYKVTIISPGAQMRLVGFNGHMAVMYYPDGEMTREWSANRKHSSGTTRTVLSLDTDLRRGEIQIRIT